MDGATLVVILGLREAVEGRAQGHRSSGPANPPDTCQSETAFTWKRQAWEGLGVWAVPSGSWCGLTLCLLWISVCSALNP